jgi:hypothetical protein
MKNILALPIVLFSLNTYALNGLDLLAAKTSAFTQAEVEIDLHEVEGWEANLEGDEVEVTIASHEEVLSYGCDAHGDEIVCHEEGDHHHLKEDDHNEMDEATETGLKKLARSLKRKNVGLEVLTGLKVWKEEEGDDHGHGHNSDFWIKASYNLNNTAKVTYIQCHQHGGEEFFCHYKAAPSDEPVFEAH